MMKYWSLTFPEEFKVGKQIFDRILKSGSITHKQKSFLEENTKEIELSYDIKFDDDSEIIVLRCEALKSGISIGRELARIIAKTIPYPVLIQVHRDYLSHLFAFEYTIDNNSVWKALADPIYTSLEIGTYEESDMAVKLIDELKDFDKSKTATSVYYGWCVSIEMSYREELLWFGEIDKLMDREDKFIWGN